MSELSEPPAEPLAPRLLRLALGERLSNERLGRQGSLPPEALKAAAAIVAEVREKGDAGLKACALRFDGFWPQALRLPLGAVDDVAKRMNPRLKDAIKQAHAHIRAFHEQEKGRSWMGTQEDGTVLGMLVRPLNSVGIYVPGGRARYPSTVLMNAVPAKVAGVKRVVMTTPPKADGTLSAATLYAARVAGVDEIYAVGGAQAIAALAYGTESIAPVDKISGPGNAYVAAAKRLVAGDVGVDMVAGPSEVCVLQDAAVDADPLTIAADLAAQAEHDPLAACYVVAFDSEAAQEGTSGVGSKRLERLVDAVSRELSRILAESPRAAITRASLKDHGLFVLCKSEADALAAVNAIAPEHLEVHVKDPWAVLGRIEAAGAIFLGSWSSEPLGDYVAGPNHTLPTGGTARFQGPLSVSDFETRSSLISYSKASVTDDAQVTQVLSQAEGLWAHGLSAGLRAKAAAGCPVGPKAPLGPIAWPQSLGDDVLLHLVGE